MKFLRTIGSLNLRSKQIQNNKYQCTKLTIEISFKIYILFRISGLEIRIYKSVYSDLSASPISLGTFLPAATTSRIFLSISSANFLSAFIAIFAASLPCANGFPS